MPVLWCRWEFLPPGDGEWGAVGEDGTFSGHYTQTGLDKMVPTVPIRHGKFQFLTESFS